ncbi:MAG: acyltransferase family protein [Acidimicrobiia bacterium]
MTGTPTELAAPGPPAGERAAGGVEVRRLPYQPALDGLRGAAVAGVLLFHGGHLTGGYLGVDAFFVLSGFLITSLLLGELAARGSIALGGFWARRARRLMPALAGVLAAVVLYAIFLARPDELATIRGDALATMAYVANWRQVLSSTDYFALFRSPSPLQHTWSLAIEEQFYLVWPLVVVLVTRGRDAGDACRRVLRLSLALTAASFLWAQFLYSAGNEDRVYYGTDTRAASILVGAALAAWMMRRGRTRSRDGHRRLQLAAIVGAIGLAYAWSQLSGGSVWLYRGGLLATAVATAVVIAACVDPDGGPVGRALAWRPLRALGLISYGVYLWHWPIYVVLDESRVHLGGWPLLLVRVAVTLVVATASYFWLERPIRHGAGAARTWRWAGPVVALTLVVAIVASTAGGSGAAAIGEGPKRGGVMVVGNSVARSLVPGLQQIGLGATNRSVVGCSLLRGRVEVWDGGPSVDCGRFRDWTAELRPQYALLVTGVYEMFDLRRENGSPLLVPGSAAFARYYTESIQRAIDELSSTGATVILPNVPCMQAKFFPADQRSQTAVNPDRLRIENGLLRTIVDRPQNRGKVVSPDLHSLLCPNGRFRTSFGGVAVVRPDGEHFSADGAKAIARWLETVVPGLERARRAAGSPIVNALEARLRRAGYYCSFGGRAALRGDPGLTGVFDCLHRGLTVDVRVYARSKALRRYLAILKVVACQHALADGTRSIDYLRTGRWVLSGDSRLMPEVAHVFGQAVTTYRCPPTGASSPPR